MAVRDPWVAAGLCAFVILAPAPLLADYYDGFNDGCYQRDPNDPRYDANDPYWTDPNNPVRWDIDNPDWTVEGLIGSTFFSSAADGWLRIFANATLFPYTAIGAGVDDLDLDPNTSLTYYDDSAPHYFLSRQKFYDPNWGGIATFIHGDLLHWSAWVVEFEKQLMILAHVHGTDWDEGVSSAKKSRPDIDKAGGFWLVAQFYGDGDPNHSIFRSAAWNGSKFDWSGTWDLERNIVTNWDPNELTYYAAGQCAVGAYGSPATGEEPDSDAKFDGIEVRWGTFTNVSHTLHLVKIKSEDYGTVTFDPDLLDDCNNIDPNEVLAGDRPTFNELRRYTDGTEVVLAATPAEGRGWKKWKIWTDPNHYPDSNYVADDTNSVLYLTMDNDYVVEAIFSCSADSGAFPAVAMALLALMIGAAARRQT
jgi:hypothetical protein